MERLTPRASRAKVHGLGAAGHTRTTDRCADRVPRVLCREPAASAEGSVARALRELLIRIFDPEFPPVPREGGEYRLKPGNEGKIHTVGEQYDDQETGGGSGDQDTS